MVMRKKRGMKDFYESNLSVQSEDLPTLSTASLTSRGITVHHQHRESEEIVPQIFFNLGDWEVAKKRIL